MSQTTIQTGQTAPDFTIPDSNKADWSLAEHVKKGDVVLCFFPLAFTGVCGMEMECLSREMARWTKSGATCVGISCDSFATLKAWGEQNGYEHPLLSDIHRTVCKEYGLYWADLNVSQRGTVVIGQSDDGVGKVKWAQAREPANAMDLDEVLTQLA